MLISLYQAVGDYIQNVFVLRLNGWILLGYAGQALFAMRFIVQWVASERVGRSVIPVAFWFFSIGGGRCCLSTRSTSAIRSSFSGRGWGFRLPAKSLISYFGNVGHSWQHDGTAP